MATSPHTRPPSWTRPWLLIVPVVLVSLLAAPSALATGEPPVNIERPGDRRRCPLGQLLTGTQGVWSGSLPMTYANQWRRCDVDGNNCTDIPSATSLTYVGRDRGHRFTADASRDRYERFRLRLPAVLALGCGGFGAREHRPVPRSRATLAAEIL